MSSDSSRPSLLVVSLFVVMGFSVLLVGAAFYYLGNIFLGETFVVLGVFFFALTLVCWFAARRQRAR